MNTNWAGRISQFEEAQVRYADDPQPGQAAFRYRPGMRPVLISAPHGAYHWRQNYWKRPDGYTAALAHVLAEYTGAHALYTLTCVPLVVVSGSGYRASRAKSTGGDAPDPSTVR